MTYKKPTYTQVPNLLLDDHMKDMDKCELKIVLAVIRNTFGWHKGRDRISYTQFEKLTGLSRASVQEGVKQALARGVMRRYEVRNGFEYALNIVDTIPENGTDKPETIPEIEHTKESILKKHTGESFDSLATSQKPVQFADYPADVQVPLLMFQKHFPKTRVDNKAKWIKQARVWGSMGLTSNDIEGMCKYAKEHFNGIAQPASITSAYNMMNTEKKEYDAVAERKRAEAKRR